MGAASDGLLGAAEQKLRAIAQRRAELAEQVARLGKERSDLIVERDQLEWRKGEIDRRVDQISADLKLLHDCLLSTHVQEEDARQRAAHARFEAHLALADRLWLPAPREPPAPKVGPDQRPKKPERRIE